MKHLSLLNTPKYQHCFKDLVKSKTTKSRKTRAQKPLMAGLSYLEHLFDNVKSFEPILDVYKYELPCFQMKPGYSSLWRDFRRELLILTKLTLFRQRRLTNYIIGLGKLTGMNSLFGLEFSLYSIIRSSKFH